MASASASLVALAFAAGLMLGPPGKGKTVAQPADEPAAPADEPAAPADEPAAKADEPAAKASAQPSADTRATAKRAFDDGLAAVAAGEFDAAVSSFEHAYALRPHPVTLFNLALALEKAGRRPEAWELFDVVIDIVESNAERREVRRHMRTIEAEIAIVEIDAKPRRRLCIDGIDMPKGDVSDYRLAVEPGAHALLLDDRAFTVAFEAGDRRVLLLEGAEDLLGGRHRGRLMPAMIGTSIGTGALALGLGIGAAVVRDPGTRTGLAAGAAASAGLAVTAGVIALLLETRRLRDPTARMADDHGDRCPGSPELERRLDLELGPTIGRPVEFAALPPPTMPIPQAFPHPRGIQPPRRSL